MVDFSAFEPKLNNWFSTVIEYQGYGRAEFLDPHGVVEGPTTIRFDEFGESTVEMTVENMKVKQPLRFGLMQLFSGERDAGDSLTLGSNMHSNPCVKLSVQTSGGEFSATRDLHYSHKWNSNGESWISFSLLRSQFDVSNGVVARYWVLPLANFVSNFRPQHGDHPLRFYSIPSIPDGLAEQDQVRAILIANSKNRIIIFNFGNEPGFIEPLPDYDERANRLRAGRERHTVTAVMVGSVGSNSIDDVLLDDWLPFDFLTLLSLATGSEVGAPWIEFRGEGGELIRRVHRSLGNPVFSKGCAAIDEAIHHGTGLLLTQAQSSVHFGQSHLRVAAKHLVRGQLNNLTVEDKLSHLTRALDGLCTDFGINKVLTPDETLSEDNRLVMKRAVRAATRAINAQATLATNQGQKAESVVLRRIAEQLGGARNIHTGFGKSVVALMEQFGLPDADIMAAHYTAHPRPDGRKWPEVLSAYRGITMHESYFDFQSGRYDVLDIWHVIQHLHDILLRMILKMLGYTGRYQPTVETWTDARMVDWVTPELPASRLGYSEPETAN